MVVIVISNGSGNGNSSDSSTLIDGDSGFNDSGSDW